MREPYFVYIIAHASEGGSEGPVKVGVTKSPGGRLASIQTGNWRRVVVAHSFQMRSRDLAYEIERTFHEECAEYRLAGEWFDLSPFDALESLCGVVFGVVNERLPEDERQCELAESGAIDSLHAISEKYWGETPQ